MSNELRAAQQSLDDVLAVARARLARLQPRMAATLLARGAIVLVDIRPKEQRARDGVIPGAVIVDRNVLEWRLAPTSRWRLDIADTGLPIAVICNQGYGSSLAAASLLDVGVLAATDIIGGFEAWRAVGLPITASRHSRRPSRHSTVSA